MTFAELSLDPQLLRAIEALGYQTPTPIQVEAIPVLLEGRDLLGIAQTGTGKTAAFVLPILQRMALARPGRRRVRTLILAPTRELAAQIDDNIGSLGKHMGFTHGVIFGGVSQMPQVQALRAGMDLLVATPGRLLDLHNQRLIDLSGVEFFVLDEADRMLDMGFVHDVRKVIATLPTERQTMLFSATMPDAIVSLSRSILKNPARVEVTPASTPVERIRQHLLLVEKENKRALLTEILRRPQITRALVFTRTKHGANRVVEHLQRAGIGAAVVHGNKSQNARERALEAFRSGEARVLVATDIAARGIDVEGISHVVNFDLPQVPEDYVHRIGRTARAGAGGIALSLVEQDQVGNLHDIEKLIGREVPLVTEHPFRATFPHQAPAKRAPQPQQQRRGQRPPSGPRR